MAPAQMDEIARLRRLTGPGLNVDVFKFELLNMGGTEVIARTEES